MTARGGIGGASTLAALALPRCVAAVAATAGALAFVLPGCGDGTATRSGSSSAVPLVTAPAQSTVRDDFVRYAACMQEHGVHAEALPGPRGGIRIWNPDASAPGPTDSAIGAADHTCRHFLKPVQTEPSNSEEATFRDSAFRFVRCLRRHGIDVGSPVIKRVAGGFDLTIPPAAGQAPAQTSAGWTAASAACKSLNPLN